jgi:ParB family chromosome partitioning protein
MMSRNRVLGKGLSALIQGADLRGVPQSDQETLGVQSIPLDHIGFNPQQPRKYFDDSKLEELSDSVRQVGILQPVLVRRISGAGQAQPHPDSEAHPGELRYCVVAGERRVRAARLAGLAAVPVIVCTYEETEALKVALLENIQREDLGPVEEAEAYRGLMNSYGATQEELAEMLGKKRSSVANMLRILTLEADILSLLEQGNISRGHAKVLLGMPPGPGRLQLAKLCHSRGLSVRECERRVQSGGAKTSRGKRKARAGAQQTDPAVRALIDRMEQRFGSPVAIERDPKEGKGSISVRFFSDDDLIRILAAMGVDTNLD